MKLIILTLLLAIGGSVAQAAPYWKVESEKRIYYAQTPRLSVNTSALDGGEEMSELLTVSLSFPIEDAQEEVNQLRKENPGYSVTKAIVSSASIYQIEIPSLRIAEAVELSAGHEGPQFTWQKYLSKKESAHIRSSLKDLASFLRVTGSLRANIPAEQVVESVRVPGSICAGLTANGHDIYNVALALPAVDEKIRALAKEEENRKILRNQVLRNCLELKRSAYVYDFSGLLNLKVDEPRVNQDFTAELKRRIHQEQLIPLNYRLVRE